jgi:hypothetical protein
MTVTLRGSYFFVKPGDKAFKVASNFTNYVELGARDLTDYYLEALVRNNEFVVNATLLNPDGSTACTISDNFPSGTPCKRQVTPNGYIFQNAKGQALFEVAASDNICHLRGKVYDRQGTLVAEDQGDDFLVYQGPLVLGKLGESLGLVVR